MATSPLAGSLHTTRVPAGSVRLSDRRTQRRWQVDVASIEIGLTPVTREQYAAITGAAPGGTTGLRHPVADVSWWDAVRFCNALSERCGLAVAYLIAEDAERLDDTSRLHGDGPRDDAITWDPAARGYRLPTEAEWEHACRAGTSGPHYGELDEIAWYRATSGERSHAVAELTPNAWGLHDMLGNVWEWCWDRYDPQVYGSYRVLRGGGWADPHWSVRASVRRRSHPTFAIEDVGFRVVRSHG